MRKLDKSSAPDEKGLPFLAEAFESGAVIEGQLLEILSVRETRSKKGYLITCEECLIFLYKSSGWLAPLMELLQTYVSDTHGYAVSIVVREEEENGIEVHVDENIDRIWVELKKFGNGTLIQQESQISGKKLKMTRRERSKG